MNRTAVRRAAAIAFSGAAMAGMIAVGQPAGAASGPTTSSKASAPAPATGAGASAATSSGSRNSGGVSAQHLDGACNVYSSGYGDLCLWYFQNYAGSRADFYFSDNDLNNNTFVTAGSGQGQRVGNNSESVWNYDQIFSARVYTGVNSTGVSGTLSPNSGGNWTATFINNVESFVWV